MSTAISRATAPVNACSGGVAYPMTSAGPCGPGPGAPRTEAEALEGQVVPGRGPGDDVVLVHARRQFQQRVQPGGDPGDPRLRDVPPDRGDEVVRRRR